MLYTVFLQEAPTVVYRMCDTIDRCEEDQESVCEPRRQKGKEHRVADSESRTQAIHTRVLVWSPLVRGYACDRNHMTCYVIEDRWIYMVMFIKKVTLFCEYVKAPTPFFSHLLWRISHP